MDRVTRYPIFSNPHSARVTGLALDGDTSYTIELVGVGPEDSWSRQEPQPWPADHEARLDVVRTGASCGRQVFPLQPAPRPLSVEEEEDEEIKAYHLDARNTLPHPQRDLEQEHRAVIRGQAVRQGSTVAMLQSAPDSSDPWPPGQPQCIAPEDNAVDREQIDFLAARRQFLSLEQTQVNPVPCSPVARAAPAPTPPELSQAPRALNGPRVANGHVDPTTPKVKEVAREEKRVCSLPSMSSVGAMGDSGFGSRVEPPDPPKETPIEREIRLAQEREADLREQRGLQRAAGHQELVRIPTRPVLGKVSLTEAPRRDRGRPSLYVQRDMVQETQREEDHRREGLQAGRAATPDEPPADPQPGLRRSRSSDSVLGPTPDARAADRAPEVRKVNRIPPDAYQPYLGPGTPQLEFSAFGVHHKPRGISNEIKAVASPRAVGPPRQLWEPSAETVSTKQERSQPPGDPLQTNRGILRWEYFHLRPLRFGVPDVPQQAETPHVWGWEVAGAPEWRLQKSQSSNLLEREVESVLRREREVAEERRNAFFPEVFSPTLDPSKVCEPDSRSSSQTSGIMGSYSVSDSPLLTPVHPHSGLVWAAGPPADSTPGQRKKEAWYAGINPSDGINSEILEATRVTRHKNAMAERWEARIYASEDED